MQPGYPYVGWTDEGREVNVSHTGWVTSCIWSLIFLITRTHISAGETEIQRGEDCGQDTSREALVGLHTCDLPLLLALWSLRLTFPSRR